MRRFCLFLSLLAGVSLPATARAEDIVVKRAPGASAAAIRDDADVQLVDSLPIPRVQVVQADDGAQALAQLNDDPRVEYAEPDREVRIDTVPLLDPLASYDWGLLNTGQFPGGGTPDDDIDAEEAWNVTTGAGATVAVVDTGIDAGHPDFAGQIAAGGYDFVQGDTTPQDGNGHGTHVAGTIAAEVNGVGITGVAPSAKIVPLRVLNNSGSGSSSNVAAGFARAGDLGVPVVNASLGGESLTQVEMDAIAQHPGTLYVVAAGNDGTNNDDAPHYPCNDPEANVLCVGASDANDQIADFSNYGAASVDLFAPGVDILSDYPRSFTSSIGLTGYEDMSGTSMATPHAAGVAALVASLHPGWTGAQIKQRLMDSVDPVPALRGLSVTGGRLNAARAVGNVDIGAPAAPAGLRATAGDGSVALAWNANAETDLAGYRVYRDGQPTVDTATPSFVATGLANDVPVTFRVTAIDQVGNESGWSTVTAVPSAPIPPPAPTQVVTAPPPAPVATPPAPPALSDVTLRGRVCAHCRATLRFRLAAVSQVRFTLQRKGSRRTSKVVAFPAGAQRVTVGKTLLGMRLKPGRWTLSVALGRVSETLHFTVKR